MTAGPRTLFGANARPTSDIGAGGGREQRVFTPESILQVPRMLWGGTIAYDPCHGVPGQVLTKAGRDAVTNETKDRGIVTSRILLDDDTSRHARGWLVKDLTMRTYYGQAVDVQSLVNATVRTDCDGLTAPWPDGTFANPPYDKLKDWLAWSLKQPTEHIMLVPVRPHRVWWRDWASGATVVYLNPVTFEGHTQSFPAPLCLALRNGDGGRFAGVCEELEIGETI